jgi:hypothetical protein
MGFGWGCYGSSDAVGGLFTGYGIFIKEFGYFRSY